MGEDPGLRCNLSKFDNKMSLQDPPLLQYRRLLQQYTFRRLAYDSDVLNAFAGMSDFLSSVADSKISFGVFDDVFDWSIFWTSQTSLQRRPNSPS